MTGTSQKFREFMLADGTNGELKVLEFKASRAIFDKDIGRLLDDYGLAGRLERAKSEGKKLRILQVECGEGLYLHRLAELLEERGLLGGAEFYGIARDREEITTAEQFSKISKPPRPYLNFYLHDILSPLETTPSLKDPQKGFRFDLIFEKNILTAAYQTKEIAARLYQTNLAAGGFIYLNEFLTREGPDGWRVPHPAILNYSRLTVGVLVSYNPGVEVAEEVPRWLEDYGAQQVQTFKHVIPIGGKTEEGKNFFRTYILGARFQAPLFINAGMMTQADYDRMMQAIYHEITQEHIGQAVFYTILAVKP